MVKLIKGLVDSIKKLLGGIFKKKANSVRDNREPAEDKISNGAKPQEQK